MKLSLTVTDAAQLPTIVVQSQRDCASVWLPNAIAQSATQLAWF
jgi:hypothetical protein